MAEVIQQVNWFMPPAGILEGSVFDIAMRYIDRKRADEIHIMEHPLYGFTESTLRDIAELQKIEAELADQEHRLLSGDEALAISLTELVQQEVMELNNGERGGVTGEAHLFFERRKAILDLWKVAQAGIAQ